MRRRRSTCKQLPRPAELTPIHTPTVDVKCDIVKGKRMELSIEIPLAEEPAVTDYLTQHGVAFEVFKKKGLNAQQFADIVITYGPGILGILNTLLDLYIKAGKIKKLL
jgi:hypothetical protein